MSNATEFPSEFNLTAAPPCADGRKRHAWIGGTRCQFCTVRRMEIWGGRSPRRSAGGMCRVRFAVVSK